MTEPIINKTCILNSTLVISRMFSIRPSYGIT